MEGLTGSNCPALPCLMPRAWGVCDRRQMGALAPGRDSRGKDRPCSDVTDSGSGEPLNVVQDKVLGPTY